MIPLRHCRDDASRHARFSAVAPPRDLRAAPASREHRLHGRVGRAVEICTVVRRASVPSACRASSLTCCVGSSSRASVAGAAGRAISGPRAVGTGAGIASSVSVDEGSAPCVFNARFSASNSVLRSDPKRGSGGPRCAADSIRGTRPSVRWQLRARLDPPANRPPAARATNVRQLARRRAAAFQRRSCAGRSRRDLRAVAPGSAAAARTCEVHRR